MDSVWDSARKWGGEITFPFSMLFSASVNCLELLCAPWGKGQYRGQTTRHLYTGASVGEIYRPVEFGRIVQEDGELTLPPVYRGYSSPPARWLLS